MRATAIAALLCLLCVAGPARADTDTTEAERTQAQLRCMNKMLRHMDILLRPGTPPGVKREAANVLMNFIAAALTRMNAVATLQDVALTGNTVDLPADTRRVVEGIMARGETGADLARLMLEQLDTFLLECSPRMRYAPYKP